MNGIQTLHLSGMKQGRSQYRSAVVAENTVNEFASIHCAGIVTKASGDGGIDGIFKEDQLGFSSIYIQAKQWASGSTVGKPEI